MDLIFKLLNQLAASLTPVEFILVLAVVALSVFSTVRFMSKLIAAKKSKLMELLVDGDNTTEEHDKISLKLDGLVTTKTHEDSTHRILTAIDAVHLTARGHAEALQTQLVSMVAAKKDVLQSLEAITKDIEEMKHRLELKDAHDNQSIETLKDILQRSQDITQRIASQIEKVDEFVRATTPEFRSYHKELSKEISELNRDIALVERSVQTQINNTNAIKLR